MKTVFSGIAALGLGLALVGCGSPTIGGQFAEPAYGWQRNGTYILTPTEMSMDCDGLVIEQGKAAKAIAYVDDVRGQRFGESLVISGVAAIFGLVRLPDMGFEERKAKEQLIQGAEAVNERLVELGCAPSDINALIAEETKKFREAQLEAAAAAVAENPTSFTVGTKSSD
ncbi:MAG TPA: hypothetical protein DFJ59_03390 [Alphaproteobacteria bacterium]|nr:hypothetical protein [Alphaproteobacteria bacterium]